MTTRLLPLRILITALIAPASLIAQPANPAPPAGVSLESLQPRVDAALARADLAAYRGWIKYLALEADTAASRSGAGREAAREKAARLAGWLDRIEVNPALLNTLRGVEEWAYESAADGTGQPFRISIPTDYDPARPPALSVYMHGYSGNHIEHSTFMHPHPGQFEIAVLGRARGGYYVGLSEDDVLEVIDYVCSHWRIDPDRIRLTGGSMGGGATLRLGARYPHRFASGQPTCGYGPDLPAGNLLTFPIYAIHSADDFTVPIVTSRGLLARLREIGGQVIFDETNGFGHAVWNDQEAGARSEAWAQRQVRPDSRSVRRLDYTATDGIATRSWWAEVAEWGPQPRPARFILLAATDNTLHAELENISRLRLRLAESPLDRGQRLRVSVGGVVPFEVAAPLPETLVLEKGSQGWAVQTNSESPAFRLRAPGGPLLLYDGSPLLIVYGTRGDPDACAAMRQAALAASRSPNPGWAAEGGEAGADGVPHHQILYGRLNVKADQDVAEADLARCHLVLIGTAAQNSLVARLADRLPVRFAGGKISCNDGLEVEAGGRMLGLVHYNPLAPQRLLFWVACDAASAYTPRNPVVQLGARRFIGADLIVMDATQPTLVLTRSFNSRWRWDAGRTGSPLLPAALGTHKEAALRIAESIRREAGADYAYALSGGPASSEAFAIGTTRLADLLPVVYYQPLGVMDLTGAELLGADQKLQKAEAGSRAGWLHPAVDAAKIEPGRVYRVAVSAGDLSNLAATARIAPRSFRMTDLLESEALERFFISGE
jgi:hypothetical protein